MVLNPYFLTNNFTTKKLCHKQKKINKEHLIVNYIQKYLFSILSDLRLRSIGVERERIIETGIVIMCVYVSACVCVFVSEIVCTCDCVFERKKRVKKDHLRIKKSRTKKSHKKFIRDFLKKCKGFFYKTKKPLLSNNVGYILLSCAKIMKNMFKKGFYCMILLH